MSSVVYFYTHFALILFCIIYPYYFHRKNGCFVLSLPFKSLGIYIIAILPVFELSVLLVSNEFEIIHLSYLKYIIPMIIFSILLILTGYIMDKDYINKRRK